MKRAPIVLTGTACGVAALVGYHAAAPHGSALASAATGSLNVSSSTSRAGTASRGTSASSARATATTPATPTARTTAASAPSGTRSAVGSDMQYPFGDLEVKVTVSGSRLVDVTVVKHDVTDPQSAMIDQYAMPLLRAQALSAQSARINGVSGASYTSAAYQQSLQAALDQLKA
ncbi:MAG TPA: FMN-binding protein [Solirubrobacteraceae bacterium]|nr:FMN-binding protein [Solirubrobacteraceae bacterium]